MPHAEDFFENESCDHQYFDSYVDMEVHKTMLTDGPRMSFYRSIIVDEQVCRGKVVVDIGSGSGILSVWAAKFGNAQHVFSIEPTVLATYQEAVMEDNGVTARVTILADTMEDIISRGPQSFIDCFPFLAGSGGVSVVVSEWMGFYLLHEGMISSIIKGREFFADVNKLLRLSTLITFVPDGAAIFVSPVNMQAYRESKMDNFWTSVDGVDLSSLGWVACHVDLTDDQQPLIDQIPAACLLHEGLPVTQLRLSDATVGDISSIRARLSFPLSSSLRFQAVAQGGSVCLDGFAFWFTVSWGDMVLNTSPLCPATHWKQTVSLLPETARDAQLVQLDASMTCFDVEVCIQACGENARRYIIEYELQ